MAILTSHEIRAQVDAGNILVEPYDEKNVQQNSIDVRLGKGVCVYKHCVHVSAGNVHSSSFLKSQCLQGNFHSWDTMLDVKKDNPVLRYEMDDSGWALLPGILYLMHTEEVVSAPNLVMTLDGRSSYARLGIIVHFTAGHAETGFHGQYTLEVSAMHPVRVYPGISIAQVIFQTVEGKVEDYRERGNYVGQAAMGAQPSRSWRQFQ